MIPKLSYQKFKTTLPVTKKSVEYRPFIVKEEKSLLIAMESKDNNQIIDAMQQMILACTFNTIDITKIPQADAEWLFLAVRNKSMGEASEVIATCSCGFKNEIDLDMSKVTVSTQQVSSNIIQLDDPNDKVMVSFNPPSVTNVISIYDPVELIATCIDCVQFNDDLYKFNEMTREQRIEWVDDLSKPNLAKLDKFFETLPKVIFDADYTCIKCGKQNHIHLEGLDSFFE